MDELEAINLEEGDSKEDYLKGEKDAEGWDNLEKEGEPMVSYNLMVL